MIQVTAKAKVLIHKPIEDVFDAILDAEKMSKYWLTRRDDGLLAGETMFWYVGQSEDAIAIEIRVKSIEQYSKIIFDWGHEDAFTTVTWEFASISSQSTRLTVEESGLCGTSEEVINQALDSTGGFNQVVIALKAYLEHGVIINVVSDHVA